MKKIKEKIALLENYQAKSTIVNPSINNVDVFTIISDGQRKRWSFKILKIAESGEMNSLSPME